MKHVYSFIHTHERTHAGRDEWARGNIAEKWGDDPTDLSCRREGICRR